MTYLSDWKEAEEAAAQAQAMHPDCTRRCDCPADDHLLDCLRFRGIQHRRALKAEIEQLRARLAIHHEVEDLRPWHPCWHCGGIEGMSDEDGHFRASIEEDDGQESQG